MKMTSDVIAPTRVGNLEAYHCSNPVYLYTGVRPSWNIFLINYKKKYNDSRKSYYMQFLSICILLSF